MLVSRRENQAAHDRCVESLAKRLSLDGWMVEAHIPGWAKPAYIEEYIPDIRARKDDSTRIIEVETEDTLYSDADQQDAFRQYALKSLEPTYTRPSATAGDESTCPAVGNVHISTPVVASRQCTSFSHAPTYT